jgi:hypothetical protein
VYAFLGVLSRSADSNLKSTSPTTCRRSPDASRVDQSHG